MKIQEQYKMKPEIYRKEIYLTMQQSQIQAMDVNSILFGMYNAIPGIYGSKIKVPVPEIKEKVDISGNYIEQLYEAYNHFMEIPKSRFAASSLSAAAKPFVPVQRHTILRKPALRSNVDYITEYCKAIKHFC